MIEIEHIKGIIFDYGGTIDTNGLHWSEVLWMKYQYYKVPVAKEVFRDAFVYGERSLAKHPYIRPEHNFLDMLRIKMKIHMEYLSEQGYLAKDESLLNQYAEHIAVSAYQYVLDLLKVSRPIIASLAARYKLVLVSNFYGNIETVLKDFGLLEYFSSIVESAVVGIRKPDPAIYQLGVDEMGFSASDVVVVGDSYSKDIVPAKSIGCQAVWLKGIGWGNEVIDESVPDVIITDIAQLPSVFE